PHQTFRSKSSPKSLQTRVRWKAGFFLAIQKDCNHYGSTGQGFPARHCPALSDTIAVLVGEEAKSLSMFFET
ncbi:HTH-type transcriptional regulator immR, partial [Dysosmobacter welbionis]